MSNRISYRHNPLWDYRANKANRMAFKMADGSERDETKRNALAALRSVAYNDGPEGIDGPLWGDAIERAELYAKPSALLPLNHWQHQSLCQWG